MLKNTFLNVKQNNFLDIFHKIEKKSIYFVQFSIIFCIFAPDIIFFQHHFDTTTKLLI